MGNLMAGGHRINVIQENMVGCMWLIMVHYKMQTILDSAAPLCCHVKCLAKYILLLPSRTQLKR